MTVSAAQAKMGLSRQTVMTAPWTVTTFVGNALLQQKENT